MGTNFYGRRQIQSLQAFSASNKEFVKEIRIEQQIHLGKASCGWNFLAQWNDGKYYTNEEEYFDFVKELEVFDEYGNYVEFKQFTNIVSTQKGKTHGYNNYYGGGNTITNNPKLEFRKGNWS